MSERFTFDAIGVEALEAEDREWRAWDEALPGFGVRIRPSGTKSWIVRARTRGADGRIRRTRITIGRCGEMSLEEARAEARKLLGEGAAAAGMADPASREGSGGGRAAPDSGGAASAEASAGGLPGASGSKIGGGVVETGADRPGEDPVADSATVLQGMRDAVARMEARSANTEAYMEQLAATVAVNVPDRRRKRRPWYWYVVAGIVGLAVGAAAGAAVQSRYPILTQYDPTLGWKDHFWEHYSHAFKDCFEKAMKEESGKVKCEIEVRGK